LITPEPPRAPPATVTPAVEFTRTNYSTLKYEITIDDPGAYTAPWTSGFYFRWGAGESFEFVCQENNKAPELIMGSDGMTVAPVPFVP
jgi:hypothetical protein